MILDDFKSSLTSKISPDISFGEKTKPASVLIVIYGQDPKILMTKKSKHLKIHAGEIAFPGGKMDKDDLNLLDTALRESKEEINLNISKSQIIGQLDPVSTLNSNFTIIPFVCILDSLPSLQHNSEVQQILEIPAHPLFHTLENDPDPEHNIIQEMYTFRFKEHLIWGASARMLKQITDKLSEKSLL